jgi:NADPH:quinone reductase-like Zn-dependent oxidoreductase
LWRPKERAVKATGIPQFRASVELLELPESRALRPDEVLINVRACGIGNWDEIARNGGWDLGIRPPMALGVEAAGATAVIWRAAAVIWRAAAVIWRAAAVIWRLGAARSG